RYDFAKKGLRAPAQSVPMPAALAQAPENEGLEGITLLKDGHLLALTEGFLDGENFRGWLVAMGAKPQFADIALKARMPFNLTDVRQLPNGDVLTLERRFSRTGGVGFEMRRVPSAKVVAGGVLDGEIVADVGMDHIIDNMEGLSVRRTA